MNEVIFFYPEGHGAHAQYGHPERPERVEVIKTGFIDSGHWGKYPKISPEIVNEDVLEAVHTPVYLDMLKRLCKTGQSLDLDTYTTQASWDLALKAAGGAVAVAKSVWHQESKRGFALTRPPGHHATSNRGMGFCLLNNIAIAAEYLLQVEGAVRLAIVDFDLHHGNGTQDIFWTREDVLYISTHQYPHYPGTGTLNEIGAGRGEGQTANFPFPPGSGDQAYTQTVDQIIIPLIERFAPEMILVSYGFDVHWRDPLGQIIVSAGCYHELILKLSEWADEKCQGRIALFLEGGYDLEAAKACSLGVLTAMLGEEWEDSIGSSPIPETNSWMKMFDGAQILWNL